MYWLARPPYLRISVAALIVIISIAHDLRPARTVDHPFATTDIRAGTEVTDAVVEMRSIPPGLLEAVDLPAPAVRSIAPGMPITASDVGAGIAPPVGWVTIAVEVPLEIAPGIEVLLVLGGLDMVPSTVPGVVTGTAGGNGFEAPLAAVAIPPDRAVDVAIARRTGQLEVLLGQ